MDINVEYKNKTGFKDFFRKVTGQKVAVLFDVNTKPFAREFLADLKKYARETVEVEFPDAELIADEFACEKAQKEAAGCDYILAVGSGTLNDIAKYTGFMLGKPSGVLATAASMDGYASNVAALTEKGYKITKEAQVPSDILVDLEIVCSAPPLMAAAGFGDLVGKYTCLTDWQLSNLLNGEEINRESFDMMQEALQKCIQSFDGLVNRQKQATANLLDALITSGVAMAICGNSRPASGSEHHISHYLEMDFARRGEKIPPHGIKVAMGALVSIELYNYLKDNNIPLPHSKEIYGLVDALPTVEHMKDMLTKIGCPVRFSQIGVRPETMRETIRNAYTVRTRFTVLTLFHQMGLTDQVEQLIMDKYY